MSDTELTLISPEGLEIAQTYLQSNSSATATATALGLPVEEVNRYLDKREVKNFIDRIYFESGFRNRERFGAVMDEIIACKLEELDETGLGTSKDILEVMKIAHDMKMKEMEMALKVAAAEKADAPQIQVNQQFNGNNYNSLLEKLTGG